jgi:hypothetical protein
MAMDQAGVSNLSFDSNQHPLKSLFRAQGLVGLVLISALLLTQVGLYLWMAPRGFDFSDESYYFLNYLYWRDFIETSTFFGAYFELPFRLLGQSVTASRIFSLMLLLASSAFFTRETLAFYCRGGPSKTPSLLAFILTGMAASLFYFSYLSTLRAPSYNLFTLCSMLVATGLLLQLLSVGLQAAFAPAIMLCYGLAVGACLLCKATSGMLLVLIHAMFFALVNRAWQWPRLLQLLIFVLVGIGLNFIVLQWAHPHWLDALREGVKFKNMDGSHNLFDLLNSVRWEIQNIAVTFLIWIVGASAVVVAVVRFTVPFRRIALSVLVAALIIGFAAGLIWGPNYMWLPFLFLLVMLLCGIEVLCREPMGLGKSDVTDVGLIALLFILPLAVSFGTNMPVLKHSQLAAVFPIAALLLRLHRLVHLNLLARSALVICLAALCIPTLAIQVRAATDVHYAYRQLSPLGAQTLRVQLGSSGNTLLVDAATRDSLQSIIGAAQSVGLSPGKTVLDFTGDGPGLLFVLGARPLGVAWLWGGFPGSEAIAANVVASVTEEELRGAWLLSSTNNPVAIKDWQQLLSSRLGPNSHVLATTLYVQAMYRLPWKEAPPKNIAIQIWRPSI